jgi:hypothetical protein
MRFAVLALCLVACAAVTAPQMPVIPGTYALCSIGGTKLPYQVGSGFPDGGAVYIVADTIQLGAGGAFTLRQHRVMRYPRVLLSRLRPVRTTYDVPQSVNKDYLPSEGSWTVTGEFVRLRDVTPQATEWFRGTFSDGRLNLLGNGGAVFIYQQAGRQCP